MLSEHEHALVDDAEADRFAAGHPAAGLRLTGCHVLSGRAVRGGYQVVGFALMQPLKAHVRNGRLVLDEPTDLPEGEIVELVQVDDALADDGDDLDDEDRAALDRDLEASFVEEEAGQLIDLADAIADLRTTR
jgi:hypothetical protein